MEETGEEDKGVPVALAARRPPPPVGSRLTIGLWRPSRRSCTRSASPRGNPNMFAMFSLAVRRLTGLEKLTYPFIIRFCFSNRFEKKSSSSSPSWLLTSSFPPSSLLRLKWAALLPPPWAAHLTLHWLGGPLAPVAPPQPVPPRGVFLGYSIFLPTVLFGESRDFLKRFGRSRGKNKCLGYSVFLPSVLVEGV